MIYIYIYIYAGSELEAKATGTRETLWRPACLFNFLLCGSFLSNDIAQLIFFDGLMLLSSPDERYNSVAHHTHVHQKIAKTWTMRSVSNPLLSENFSLPGFKVECETAKHCKSSPRAQEPFRSPPEMPVPEAPGEMPRCLVGEMGAEQGERKL